MCHAIYYLTITLAAAVDKGANTYSISIGLGLDTLITAAVQVSLRSSHAPDIRLRISRVSLHTAFACCLKNHSSASFVGAYHFFVWLGVYASLWRQSSKFRGTYTLISTSRTISDGSLSPVSAWVPLSTC